MHNVFQNITVCIWWLPIWHLNFTSSLWSLSWQNFTQLVIQKQNKTKQTSQWKTAQEHASIFSLKFQWKSNAAQCPIASIIKSVCTERLHLITRQKLFGNQLQYFLCEYTFVLSIHQNESNQNKGNKLAIASSSCGKLEFEFEANAKMRKQLGLSGLRGWNCSTSWASKYENPLAPRTYHRPNI